MSALFLHCRPGFEAECAAEIQQQAATHGVSGYCKARQDSAYVIFQPHEPAAAARLHAGIDWRELIFVRQWFVAAALCQDMAPADRVTPITAAVRESGVTIAGICLETPDTNEGKELSGLCRALQRPLQAGLERAGLWSEAAGHILHVCFMSSAEAHVGYARRDNSPPWPMGIPRLRFPAGAPSRSTLKLEEAFLQLLDAQERETLLHPGMRAVDLGAAPGGWTYQLVRRHLRVVAVDNGAIDAALLESGLVEHQRVDGFRYWPVRPVDWMVCDIVEQPRRIADLAARWIAQGACRQTIFNLKLPMKKRYAEVMSCLEHIHALLDEAGVGHRLRCRHLYHDREEVTVFLQRC